MSDIIRFINEHIELLPLSLGEHIQRTRKIGFEISSQFNVDPELVDLSISGHDIARQLDNISLIEEAISLGILIGEIEQNAPILLHGPIAATWISNAFLGGIDEKIIEAIYFHTTGKPDMSDVSKVTFLADKLDPEKIKRRPSLMKVKSEVNLGLDHAILKFLDLQIAYSIKNNWVIPKLLKEFRDSLLAKSP